MGRIGTDRAGGCRREAGVNPPANHSQSKNNITLRPTFSPKSEPPDVLPIEGLKKRMAERGIPDSETEQASLLLDHMGYEHVKLYIGEGAPLKLTHAAMLFDLTFQSVIIKYIGLFELSFRSRCGREMAERRGAFAHRNPKNFINREFFENFLERYGGELGRKVSTSRRVAEKYNLYGDVPIWCAVEIMSMGTLSKLYRNTKSKAIKNAVAKRYGVDFTTFSSWLRSLTDARNRCAHFGRFLGIPLSSRPKKMEGVTLDNGNAFYIVLLLIELLMEDVNFVDDPSLSHHVMLIRDVSELILERPEVSAMAGIPGDWQQAISQVLGRHEILFKVNTESPDVGLRRTYATISSEDGISIVN